MATDDQASVIHVSKSGGERECPFPGSQHKAIGQDSDRPGCGPELTGTPIPVPRGALYPEEQKLLMCPQWPILKECRCPYQEESRAVGQRKTNAHPASYILQSVFLSQSHDIQLFLFVFLNI